VLELPTVFLTLLTLKSPKGKAELTIRVPNYLILERDVQILRSSRSGKALATSSRISELVTFEQL
jgi:hypothetical protein